MHLRTKTIMRLLTLAALAIAASLIAFTSGCANQTSKEWMRFKVVKQNGDEITIDYRPEMAQWSLLSFTKADNIEHITPFSSTCVGEWETYSDPNSIDSAGGLMGSIIRAAIK